ncbi:MAG: NAD(P)H-quinone oxidoreductase [Christensenellales bacterium]|jgi:NADPH2:quinone reductase
MKAMLINRKDGSLCWADVEKPSAKADEVVIEIYATALNRADLLQRAGTYPSPKGWPEWMGLEVSGIVCEVGANAKRWKVGDRVCALLGGGGYAEYVAVPENMAMPIPEGMNFETAASLPEAYATCYLNLFIEGEFKPGETLFFPAGASGLASVGIPMAHAFGAYVITSVLTADIKRRIRHLPADVVIDTSSEDAVDALRREAENGHPIDVAIDCLAGETIGKVFPYVNEGCRWVLISTLDGITTTVPLRALLTKGITFKGSMLRKRSVEEKANLLHMLVRDVWPKLESGEIVPTIYKVLPIEQADAAHDILKRGEHVGKVVLRVKSG